MTLQEEIDAFLDYYGHLPICHLCKEIDIGGLKVSKKFYCIHCVKLIIDSIDNLLSKIALKEKYSNLKDNKNV